MTNIAVFASGSGSNCENLIRYFSNSDIGRVALVMSNRASSPVLERAKGLGVETVVVSRDKLNTPSHMLPILKQYDIRLIVLAGFLPIIPDYLIDGYPQRIVNIHPSLLPKFGGKGMWGRHVHEAVKKAGERETGMTVHYVTPECDGGGIVAQFSTPLSPDDTIDDIAEKEHLLEMNHFPRVIEKLINDL